MPGLGPAIHDSLMSNRKFVDGAPEPAPGLDPGARHDGVKRRPVNGNSRWYESFIVPVLRNKVPRAVLPCGMLATV
jgi:hypothetical protein